MGNIILLDELTINKIAAGEVIERPASVIKEMVENSIDAKATNITIEIKNGGISYIKITDNGKGIAKDDLEMAFERHATSKIRCAEDLNTVTSMGFRGEALASIAAIANVELISKTLEQEVGYKVVVEGGNILEKQEIGCQTGTTITVQNLFFNTPVRYKFLKKDYTETGYIEDVVTRIALINPHIAFKLINSGKTILQTSGNGDLKSVVYSIYGKDIAQEILEVYYNYEDMKIKGVVGKPQIARSNRSNQLFFVNRRYIKDKILTAATEQAYKGIIENGKFGFVVLNIDMPQSKVDVNVHPAKLEVRFQEESKIFQAIFHAIKDTISKNSNNENNIDNKIVENSINTNVLTKTENVKPESIKQVEGNEKGNGLFGWRKNKKLFENENNIIEDLYNKKKVNEIPTFSEEKYIPKAFESLNSANTINEKYKVDDAVNTSDVLEELRHINESVKKEIKEEAAKKETKDNIYSTNLKFDSNKKDLPDGTTYTYVGENKEKIESLLRQLHPELYKENQVEQVNEEETLYEIKSKEELEDKETINSQINTVSGFQDTIEVYTPILSEEPKFETPKEIEAQEAQEEVEVQAAQEEQSTQQEEVEVQEVQEEQSTQPEEVEVQETQEEQSTQQEKVEVQETQKEQSIQPGENLLNEETPNDFSKMYEKLFGTPIIKDKTNEEKEREKRISAVDIIQDNVSVFEKIENYQKPTYKFIGIVFDIYIIAEIEKEMYIINQRTAKEKIMYEKLKNNYYNQVNKDSQMLLLPDIMELSNKQMDIIKENYDILTRAGFSLEEFGENTIRLSGVPTVCLDLDTKSLFIEILEAINTVAFLQLWKRLLKHQI